MYSRSLNPRPSHFHHFPSGPRLNALVRRLRGSSLRSPRLCPHPLLQQPVLAVTQRRRLSVVHALKPISEAGTTGCVDGVDPQRALVEKGAHLDANLPEAHGQACLSWVSMVFIESRGLQREWFGLGGVKAYRSSSRRRFGAPLWPIDSLVDQVLFGMGFCRLTRGRGV